MFKITLSMARETHGVTLGVAALRLGMERLAYRTCEINPGQAPLSVIARIANLFNVPLSIIYHGHEDDYANRNKHNLDHIMTTQLSKMDYI